MALCTHKKLGLISIAKNPVAKWNSKASLRHKSRLPGRGVDEPGNQLCFFFKRKSMENNAYCVLRYNMYMYVYMYICVYVYMYVYIYIYVCVYVNNVYVNVYVYEHVYYVYCVYYVHYVHYVYYVYYVYYVCYICYVCYSCIYVNCMCIYM